MLALTVFAVMTFIVAQNELSLAEKSATVRTASGELLAAENTRWSFMDVRARVPAIPPRGLFGGEVLLPAVSLAPMPRRIRLPLDTECGDPFFVRYCDTDTNLHVNNVRFVHLAAASAAVELDDVRSLSVEYLHEAHEGETLLPRIFRAEREITVSLDREGLPCASFVFRL